MQKADRDLSDEIQGIGCLYIDIFSCTPIIVPEREINMTRKELKIYLKDHLVPARLYDLKSNHKNRLCMEKAKNGYDIYFSDHKEKIGLLHFATESEACQRMKEEISKLMVSLYGLSFVG